MNLQELEGKSFACIPGCGFCCSFPAAVTAPERMRLQAHGAGHAVEERRGVLSLKLQGGCGGCALLKDKACTVYDARPNPCRFFPFHVYFGRHVEVYVNYTCRGVVSAPGGNLHDAFLESVIANVTSDEMTARALEARETHADFERIARKEGAWDDPQAVLDAILPLGSDLFTRRGLEAVIRHAGEDASAEDALEGALSAFTSRNPTHRPYYLDPATRWLTFQSDKTGMALQELHETGRIDTLAVAPDLRKWEDPAPAVRDALYPYLVRLTRRDLFVGTAFSLVDEHEYEAPVREAVAARVGEIVVDLALRARLVPAALGRDLPPAEVADEVARFYDGDFLDAPTVGGFL